MLSRPDSRVVQTIKNAMKTMTRLERRRFQAQVVIVLLYGLTITILFESIYVIVFCDFCNFRWLAWFC